MGEIIFKFLGHVHIPPPHVFAHGVNLGNVRRRPMAEKTEAVARRYHLL